MGLVFIICFFILGLLLFVLFILSQHNIVTVIQLTFCIVMIMGVIPCTKDHYYYVIIDVIMDIIIIRIIVIIIFTRIYI